MRMRHKKNLGSRMEACGERLIYLSPEVLDDRAEDPSAVMLEPEKMLGSRMRYELELGCGKGSFACEYAKRSPDTGLIAVESLDNVIVAGSEQAAVEGIDNVCFVCVGGQYLTRYIPAHSISRIILNFSCPYPKSGGEGKRLTSPHFLAFYKQLLCEGGEIWQKTDDPDFFEYSLEQYRTCGFDTRNITTDLHGGAYSCDDRALIITEYERRFMEQGKPICRVEAVLRG